MDTTLTASVDEAERLTTMADAVHYAAQNLALTYGVFHGVNSLRGRPLVNGRVAQAINCIQHDLLHLMAIRVCALCDHGPRPDDASIVAIERRITPAIRDELVARDVQWREKVGATRMNEVAKSIASLRRKRSILRSHDAELRRAKHFRDKLLAHVTVSHDPANRVMLSELWKLTRITLSAARCVRLIIHREDWDYLSETRNAQQAGEALARAILPGKKH